MGHTNPTAGPDLGAAFVKAVGGTAATEGVFVPNGWYPEANTFQNNAIGAPRPNHLLDQYRFQLEGPAVIPNLLKKDASPSRGRRGQ